VRKKFLALVGMHNIQVVEAPEFDAESIFLELFGCPVPVVVRLHTGTQIIYKIAGKAPRDPVALLAIIMEWLAILKADALTAPTHFMAVYCKKALKLPDRNIQILPNAIDFANEPHKEKHTPPRSARVLYVGRLERRKFPDFLAQVIPEILKIFPNTIFTFIGQDVLQGPGKSSMRNYCESLIGNDCMKSVEFLGKRSHDEVEDYLSRSDIFVLPSKFESFGIAYVEDMFHGLPVVACLGTGVEEVIPQNVAGFLVEHGNPGALRDAIIRLLGDDLLRWEMGRAGKEFALNHFSAPVVAEAHEVFYHSLICGKAG
jgi:glycosyltransferase involved in cell wall biosynthesis